MTLLLHYLRTCFSLLPRLHPSSSSPPRITPSSTPYNFNFIPNVLFPLFTRLKLMYDPTETRSQTPCNIWGRLLELEMGKFCSFVPLSSVQRFHRFPVPFFLLSSSCELNLVAASSSFFQSRTRSLPQTCPVRLRLGHDSIRTLPSFPPR